MDYDLLLEGCCEIGGQLLRCGAEIHRAEDTVQRLLDAYRVDGDVFAIPNCLIVSIHGQDGQAHTRMRRVPMSSIDIEGIERYNSLSRRLCARPPEDPGELLTQCRQVSEGKAAHQYSAPLCLAGYFIGAFFFAIFFAGGWAEALAGALAGLAAGICMTLLTRARANFFITTLVSGFVLGLVAYALLALGIPANVGLTVAGGLMVLVPGLVFTNFMSNLLTGDIVAGLCTFVRAVLTAAAIALGTGAATALGRALWHVAGDAGHTTPYSAPVCCLLAFIACLGFCFPYNAHGLGVLLCCLGGAVGWAAYLAVLAAAGGNVYVASLVAAIAVAIYAEAMARLRKCPATS